MPLTFSSSELVALCIESVLYGASFNRVTHDAGLLITPNLFPYLGIYLLMFLDHLEIIFRRQRRGAVGTSLRLPVVLATSAIFALVTAVCVDSCVLRRIWDLRCDFSLIHLPPNFPLQ